MPEAPNQADSAARDKAARDATARDTGTHDAATHDVAAHDAATHDTTVRHFLAPKGKIPLANVHMVTQAGDDESFMDDQV